MSLSKEKLFSLKLYSAGFCLCALLSPLSTPFIRNGAY